MDGALENYRKFEGMMIGKERLAFLSQFINVGVASFGFLAQKLPCETRTLFCPTMCRDGGLITLCHRHD